MKWLRSFWNFITNPFETVKKPVPDSILGVPIKTSEACPKDSALLIADKDAVRIDLKPQSDLIWEYVEGNGDAKILSISLWSEGRKCEHTYKKVATSKAHNEAVYASGIHKDYICSKCGHSLCAVVSNDAQGASSMWDSILGKKGQI